MKLFLENKNYVFISIIIAAAILIWQASVFMVQFSYATTTGTVTNVHHRTTIGDHEQKTDVKYEYTVDGKVYTGSYMADGYSTAYSEGDSIKVYYRTSKPQTSETNRSIFGFVIWSPLTLIYLIYAIWLYIKKCKEG